jgi:hypothetical protein
MEALEPLYGLTAYRRSSGPGVTRHNTAVNHRLAAREEVTQVTAQHMHGTFKAAAVKPWNEARGEGGSASRMKAHHSRGTPSTKDSSSAGS